MPVVPVVVNLDVLDDRGPSFGPSREICLVIHLIFQGDEERFSDGVDAPNSCQLAIRVTFFEGTTRW